MKFAVNRYDLNFHVILEDPAPIPDAQLEHHPFGLPPFEIRPIWTVDIADLDQLLGLIERLGTSLDVSRSGFWSGFDLANPGERLFGISLIDDPTYEIDPRDRPIPIPRHE
jgi:hypothetical protein